ncbi:PqqD family peptide modification chaperone [Piscinibacter sakaiensis]|uniref:PqqD family peptide modification chaperone n=1 Tax=Piscinibacter sakaiensis TaxID=1547922 RepID=UPI003AAEA83C
MTTVHSSRWHRVASLKPRLSPHLRVRRQHIRGETWVLLDDQISGRSVRLNAAAHALVGRFDGRRSVQNLWDAALERDDDVATQDEVIDLLAQLREAGLIQFDRSADFDLLLPHLDTLRKPKGRKTLIAWRIPLANPSRLLERLDWLGRLLFNRLAFALWLLAMAMLLVLGLQHAPTLWAHAGQWMATPRFALLALLLYLPIKLAHEIAHGLAVRRWGGQVREAGVTLMMLMPVPYVDASAATGFEQRRHRIIVSAAGIITELSFAAVALPLWLLLADGWLRDAAFVTLVVAGASTLLFNGNPLQRLDGYYIFTDALELPNLGPRSRNWWQQTLRRRLLRLPGAETMPVARGETTWLALYAPLSWLYGLTIATVATLWLGSVSLALGLACAAILGWQMMLRPVVNHLRQLRNAALAQTAGAGRWRGLAFGGSLALAAVLLLPAPQRTLVQGVVWPAEKAQLRADEQGIVTEIVKHDGDTVRAGELVLQLRNADLQAELARQSARVGALEAALFDAMPVDGNLSADGKAGDARADLSAAQAALERLIERERSLAVRAHADGRLVLPRSSDLQGQYVARGNLIGQVLTDDATIVRVAVPESAAADLQRGRGEVSVRLAASRDTAHPASLLRDSGGAVLQLPSAALSERHGGQVVTDPSDKTDLTPLHPVVLLDVVLAAGAARSSERIGERAAVRFDAGFSPLAWQWAQGLRRHIQQRFNPQF